MNDFGERVRDRRNRSLAGESCFMPSGVLPNGDIMPAQKIALDTFEEELRAVVRRFIPNGFHLRSWPRKQSITSPVRRPRAMKRPAERQPDQGS
jgi:hypothetical protein